MKIKITVHPRRQVLDPQGQAVAKALRELGFDKVKSVRQGKCFTLDIDQAHYCRDDVVSMCEKLLVNPVIEDFTIDDNA